MERIREREWRCVELVRVQTPNLEQRCMYSHVCNPVWWEGQQLVRGGMRGAGRGNSHPSSRR